MQNYWCMARRTRGRRGLEDQAGLAAKIGAQLDKDIYPVIQKL